MSIFVSTHDGACSMTLSPHHYHLMAASHGAIFYDSALISYKLGYSTISLTFALCEVVYDIMSCDISLSCCSVDF